MTSNLKIAIRFTLITAVLLGLVYPLVITAFAHLTMPHNADGQLIVRDGKVIGSEIIGQSFTGDTWFHSRPSEAGNGYDAANSSGSNLALSNKKLVGRIQGDVATYQKSEPGKPVPIDLVTASGSGLDPDISPAAALYQVHRVAAARHLPEDTIQKLVQEHIQGRQFGLLGEPRVNVLELNLALDAVSSH
jgi:potassium-transporting ATPase KdpC subunit